jgi:chromosome segregation ATPase
LTSFPLQSEARVQANHSRLIVALQKAEADYLNAKRRFDAAQSSVDLEVKTLETVRNSAREATERMQDKAAEVDSLRSTLAMDERERELKLTQLKGPVTKKSGFWTKGM